MKLCRVAVVSLLTGLAQLLPALGDTSTADTEGRELARQLLAQPPAENSAATGILKIRDAKGKRTEIPLRFQTTITASNWLAVYETSSGATVRTKLVVIHADGKPNQYLLTEPSPPKNEGRIIPFLTGNEAMIPFAGSDFWLADLGLEFLHWPEQRVLKTEMRRGQSCKVLESANPQPAPGGYARVVSWIDIDTGGIVHAEAFDADKKLLKEFDPKEFKKVKGEWQLHEMEIRNRQTGSRTRLEFDLEKK